MAKSTSRYAVPIFIVDIAKGHDCGIDAVGISRYLGFDRRSDARSLAAYMVRLRKGDYAMSNLSGL
jgi:hypothetical protein